MNLIPASRQRLQRVARRRQVWYGIVAVYAVGAIMGTTLLLPRTSEDEREIARELSALRNRASELDAKNRMENDRLAQARRQLSSANAVGEQPDWSVLLGILAQERRTGLTLTSMELSTQQVPIGPPPGSRAELDLPEPGAKPGSAAAEAAKKRTPAMRESYTLRVDGLASDPDEAYRYAARLEQTGLFSQAKVIDTKPSALGARKMSSFRLQCDLATTPVPKAKATASAEKEAKP